MHAEWGANNSFASAGVETTAQLWTEDRRALEISIHKEKTRDHENWEPDLLSQVARKPCSWPAFGVPAPRHPTVHARLPYNDDRERSLMKVAQQRRACRSCVAC